MPLATLLGCVIAIQAADVKTYSHPDLGLAFQVPASWQVTTNKRLGETKFVMPAGPGQAPAQVLMYAIATRDTIEDWQTFQQIVAKQMKLTLEKQWQEELLGVPLLLTRTKMIQGGEPVTILNGLLYTATSLKMNFRLVSPSGSFAVSEQHWRDVLLSLRTASGELPVPEDPSKPRTNNATPRPKPEEKPKPIVRMKPESTAAAPKLAPESWATKAAAKDVVLRFPSGWSVAVEGDHAIFKHKDLKGTVSIEVLSTIDSPAPLRALNRASGQSLPMFDAVKTRLDKLIHPNRAGATVDYVIRTGTYSAGSLRTIEGVGAKSGFYWLLRYRSPDGAPDADTGLIQDLLEQMSVEPAA